MIYSFHDGKRGKSLHRFTCCHHVQKANPYSLDISSRHNVAFFTMRGWEKPKKYAIDRSRQNEIPSMMM
jgi:hypothetical protein